MPTRTAISTIASDGDSPTLPFSIGATCGAGANSLLLCRSWCVAVYASVSARRRSPANAVSTATHRVKWGNEESAYNADPWGVFSSHRRTEAIGIMP